MHHAPRALRVAGHLVFRFRAYLATRSIGMTRPEITRPAACRRDRVIAGALLMAALVLRIAYVSRYRINTDEPQHLHVVWAWTQGLLPYRDVFDNHAPLFHMLLAPVAAALGERPDILTWMRVAMIPLSALTLWCTYLIGRALFSRAVGVWAAIFLALLPRFFLTSIEFRADTLWAALWIAALAALLGGRLTPMRSFVGGALLGADVAVSLKSTMCLVALAGACATVASTARARLHRSGMRVRVAVATAVLGFVIVPLATTAYFAGRGALAPFAYGTIGHNVLPAFGTGPGVTARLLVLLAFVPIFWAGLRIGVASTPAPGRAARRTVLLLTGVLYVALLEGAWPLETKQDYQVCFPILMIFLAVLAVGAARFMVRSLHLRVQPASTLAVVALVEVTTLLHIAPPGVQRGYVGARLLDDVIRLTRPVDPIMDLKGETIFRRRPFYYVLESFTRERLRRGLIADTIPERMIATQTCVAVADSDKFPPRAREFLRDNYISVGRLRVVGRVLSASPASAAGEIVFPVTVAAAYTIISPTGTADGDLDGEAYRGSRFLAPGQHVFRPRAGGEPLALVWTRAVERGFSPFADGTAL